MPRAPRSGYGQRCPRVESPRLRHQSRPCAGAARPCRARTGRAGHSLPASPGGGRPRSSRTRRSPPTPGAIAAAITRPCRRARSPASSATAAPGARSLPNWMRPSPSCWRMISRSPGPAWPGSGRACPRGGPGLGRRQALWLATPLQALAAPPAERPQPDLRAVHLQVLRRPGDQPARGGEAVGRHAADAPAGRRRDAISMGDRH